MSAMFGGFGQDPGRDIQRNFDLAKSIPRTALYRRG